MNAAISRKEGEIEVKKQAIKAAKYDMEDYGMDSREVDKLREELEKLEAQLAELKKPKRGKKKGGKSRKGKGTKRSRRTRRA
jgi:hypothetical protein